MFSALNFIYGLLAVSHALDATISDAQTENPRNKHPWFYFYVFKNKTDINTNIVMGSIALSVCFSSLFEASINMLVKTTGKIYCSPLPHPLYTSSLF